LSHGLSVLEGFKSDIHIITNWSITDGGKDLHSEQGWQESFVPYENIFTLEKCLSFKQRNDKTTTEFAAQVNVMYDSVIHQNGCTSFGESFPVTVLERHGMSIGDYTTLTQEFRDPYDHETRDLIVAMLILKNSSHDRARDQ
jgi:hypothetical protein